MEIFEPFLDLNNLKFVGKSNGMHEFSSKQLFIIVSYFVYEMYHCAAVLGSNPGSTVLRVHLTGRFNSDGAKEKGFCKCS